MDSASSFVITYVLVPLIFSLAYITDSDKKDLRKRQLLAVKFGWYIFLAIIMLYSYLNGKDMSRAVTGYTLAIALFEGIPGLYDCFHE